MRVRASSLRAIGSARVWPACRSGRLCGRVQCEAGAVKDESGAGKIERAAERRCIHTNVVCFAHHCSWTCCTMHAPASHQARQSSTIASDRRTPHTLRRSERAQPVGSPFATRPPGQPRARPRYPEARRPKTGRPITHVLQAPAHVFSKLVSDDTDIPLRRAASSTRGRAAQKRPPSQGPGGPGKGAPPAALRPLPPQAAHIRLLTEASTRALRSGSHPTRLQTDEHIHPRVVWSQEIASHRSPGDRRKEGNAIKDGRGRKGSPAGEPGGGWLELGPGGWGAVEGGRVGARPARGPRHAPWEGGVGAGVRGSSPAAQPKAVAARPDERDRRKEGVLGLQSRQIAS